MRLRSSDRYRSGRGGSLGLAVTGLDPWIDTGHTVTACGVTGGGLLTAPGRVISVRVFPARWGDRRDR